MSLCSAKSITILTSKSYNIWVTTIINTGLSLQVHCSCYLTSISDGTWLWPMVVVCRSELQHDMAWYRGWNQLPRNFYLPWGYEWNHPVCILAPVSYRCIFQSPLMFCTVDPLESNIYPKEYSKRIIQQHECQWDWARAIWTSYPPPKPSPPTKNPATYSNQRLEQTTTCVFPPLPVLDPGICFIKTKITFVYLCLFKANWFLNKNKKVEKIQICYNLNRRRKARLKTRLKIND